MAWPAHFQLPQKRLSRAPGELAWALIRPSKLGFPSIGRALEGAAHPASGIARLYRFCHNPRVDPTQFQTALVQLLASRATLFGKELAAVALDWIASDTGSMAGLRVNLVTGSRAIPLQFHAIHEDDRRERQAEHCWLIRDLPVRFGQVIDLG